VFYDAMIWKADGSAKLRQGISYILRIWLDNLSASVQRQQCKVTIVTRAEETETPGQRFEERLRMIDAKLCRRLASEHGIRVELDVKEHSRQFHARHLYCGGRSFNFERGFDLFLEDGFPLNFARNFVFPQQAGNRHLKTLRDLKSIDPSCNE
ncbi:MAG: hypothetical protein ACLFVU_04435, partial [Phycisphaerae bacterium]